MNKKLIAVSIIVGFLMSVMSVCGYVVVTPPPSDIAFASSGATYTAYYQCGTEPYLGVTHDFYLRIHNTKKTQQYFYVKILDEISAWAQPSYWFAYGAAGATKYYRFPIDPDALVALDCSFILGNLYPPGLTWGRGVIILSHPGAATDLDVIATEISYVGGPPPSVYNEQVVYVPGVKVSKIPTPCVIPTGKTEGCVTLPP